MLLTEAVFSSSNMANSHTVKCLLVVQLPIPPQRIPDNKCLDCISVAVV